MTVPVVIMAGGRGLRLHPLTSTQPKVLFRVGGKAILEQIIDGYAEQGHRQFWLCVNYRADLIERHFGDGSSRGLDIRYVREEHPLGTAGAVGLLPDFGGPFIVSNGDVLARISYADLLVAHDRANAEATVALALHQYQVPFGVADFEDEKFVGLREKPIQNVLVNSGIYVLSPSAKAKLPPGYFDMPDLIALCRPLAYFPIESAWHDCGSFQDLARANNSW